MVRVETGGVDEPGLEAGGARAHDVHVVEVPGVQRRLRTRARALERELEDARIRLLDALVKGVDQHVEMPRQIQTSEVLSERAVRVGDDDEAMTGRAQARERVR